MIPLAVKTCDIGDWHLNLLEVMKRDIKDMPEELTCHQVVDLLAAKYPMLTKQRGYFVRKGIEHSWLLDAKSEVLFDPYPWAASEPIVLTYKGCLNPWRFAYIPTDPAPDRDSAFWYAYQEEILDKPVPN